MSDRWRAYLRVLLFLVAVLAIVAIGGFSVRTLLRRGGEVKQAEIVQVAPPPPQGSKSLVQTLLGFYLSLRQGEIDQPANPADSKTVDFVVSSGDTASMIGPRLESMGLIRDASLFGLLVRYRGVDSSLEAGHYKLSPSMSLDRVVNELQHGSANAVTVTIPEGWRMEQVAAKLAEAGLGKPEDFLALMRKHDYPYPWLQSRPSGAPSGLEGFLFPDTYQFSAEAKPAEIIDTMLKNFDRRVTPELHQSLSSHGLTFYEAIVLASVVEREAVVAQERPTIAAVFLLRLEEGMYLQADPTVSYAKGFDAKEKRWWTPMQAEESKSVDSPFNTFLHPGLMPGPICSPGLSSIEGVARPAGTKYLYFVSKGDGSHAFAETFDQHLANMSKYQR